MNPALHARQSVLLYAALSLLLAAATAVHAAEAKPPAWPPPKIVVAAGKDSPPYYFQDELGRPRGWLVDVWRLWAEKTGIAVDFRMAPFGDSVEMVRSRQADVHAGLFYSETRDRFLDYVVPLAQVSTHFFHHKSILGIRTLEELMPYRIGVIKGDYALEVLKQRIPSATIITFNDNDALFDAVARGEIKVFVKDTLIALTMLADRGLMNEFTHTAEEPLYTKPFVAVVPEDEQRLPALIKNGMKQITLEELAAIERKWSGKAQVRTKDILIIACMLDNAPFTYLTEDGEPSGLFIDLWDLWASRTGQIVEYRFGKWQQTLDDLAQGRADIHFGLYQTEARSLWLDFSNPMYPVGTKLFTTTDRSTSLAGMAGKRVAVLKGSFQEEYLHREHPEVSMVPYTTLGEMVRATADGSVEAFFNEDASSRDTIDRLGMSGTFHAAETYSFVEHLHAGVAKGHTPLLEMINQGFANISNSEIIHLEERWIRNPQSRLFAQAPRTLLLTEEEKAWLKEHPVIRLGVDASWPPFEYIDDRGEYKGIASDYVELISDMLGVQMIPQRGLSWQEVLNHAKGRTLDVIPCITPSNERGEYLLFTSPYLKVRNVIAAQRSATFFNGLNDLKGKKVAVVNGYLVHSMIAGDHPDIELVPVKSLDEGIEAVARGRVAAYVDTSPSIAYALQKMDRNDIMIMAATPYTSELGFGVRSDWGILAEIIDKALYTIPEQTKQEIQNLWVHRQVERAIDWGYVWRVLAVVISVSLLVLLFIGIWNRRLAREIENRKQAERELNDQLSFQVALIDTIPNPIFIKDAKGRYVGCNKMYEQAFGTSRDAMWGKSVKDMTFLPEEKREDFYQEDQAILKDRTAWHREMRLPFADGKTHDVLYWKVPFDLADGRLGGMLGVIVDISKLRETEQELRKLSQAVEQSPVTVVMTDKQGTIEYVNPTFTEITGYSAQEALGNNPRILKGGQMPEDFYKELWETILSGKTWKGDLINRKKNGQEFWESASISPIFNEQGEITHFVAVKEDITNRKLMEEALHQAKNQAEDATRAKSDFLANMSHEIRTPMNAIMGMTHLAMQTDLTPKQHDYLEKIDTSARALLRIINDILDFSKIEAGKLDMESVPFQLEEVLDNLSSLITVKAQEKGIEVLFAVDPDVPAILIGDPLRLGQVLINLASNAVKFTDKGEIVVSVGQLERGDKQCTLRFDVRDTGIGLTMEQRDKLFKAFSQADTSTTRKFGGTGLGLAISKRLVDMMHGEINVQSEPGRGSTFSFTARFGIHEKQGKTSPRLLDDFKNMKVLVVDDNQTSRDILEQALRNFGFQVTLAASGAEALDILENSPHKEPFELVLMDWKMPGMDGMETSHRIKNHDKLGRIPTIIMVTAYGREEVMDRAQRIGLDGFLIKPVSQSVLFNTIMDAFGHEAEKSDRRESPNDISKNALALIHGARILLVEDNEINQQVAKEILTGAGLVVRLASNGREALEQLEKNMPDAVLMDIQMPVLDGLETTRILRGKERFKDLPVIAMTAHAMAGDREKSLEAGMNDHVTKPIDPAQLFKTLAKWVKGPGELPPPDEKASVERSKIALPDAIDGIDMEEGLSRLGGNRKLYRDLLVKFRTEYASAAAKIDSLLDAHEFDEARRLAHSVKGVTGNLGAVQLHATAAKLENAIHNDADDAPAKLASFARHLERVVLALEAISVDEEPTGDKQSGSPTELLTLLEDLDPHLRASKPKKCEPVLAQINDRQWPGDLSPLVQELSNTIKKYKFKDALGIARQLREQVKGG